MEISFLLSGQQISLPLNIFLFFSILALNFFIPFYIAEKFRLKFYIPFTIIIINFVIYSLFLIFEEYGGSDGISFFSETFGNEIYPFQIRDNLIIKLSLIFKDLKIHYLIVTLLTNILSAISFLLIYLKFKQNKIINNFNYFLIFFIVCNSGMLFWSNGLLKDNFILFAVTLFLYSINSNKINFKILISAIIICLLIRPLIGFFIILSIVIFYNMYFLLKKKFIDLIKLNLLIVLPFIVIFKFILDQYGLKFDIYIFQQIINEIQSYANSSEDPGFIDGFLTYDTSEMRFYEQYLKYYFGPLIPINTIFIFLSIQNFANLIILITFTFNIIFNLKKLKDFILVSNLQCIFFLYSIIYTMIVPLTCYNLGIAFRQKWMGLVIMTYLMLFFISFCRRKKI